MAQLQVTLTGSPIGYEKSQGLTAFALGLRKRGKTVVVPDNPSVRGMVFKIRHLVEVTEIADDTNGESDTK